MVKYENNWTLSQVGATSRSRPANQEIKGMNAIEHSPGMNALWHSPDFTVCFRITEFAENTEYTEKTPTIKRLDKGNGYS